MIEELIARIFALRDYTYLRHWAERNGEAHRALAYFYDAISDALDPFVEQYQGLFGLIGEVPVISIRSGFLSDEIRAQREWILANIDTITKNDPQLVNELHGICAIYAKTLYTLDFLE
jgi:hypothetical protein